MCLYTGAQCKTPRPIEKDEDGSHTTLLKKKGMYAALWKRQSGGFIEE
jgi:hypothetical protein